MKRDERGRVGVSSGRVGVVADVNLTLMAIGGRKRCYTRHGDGNGGLLCRSVQVMSLFGLQQITVGTVTRRAELLLGKRAENAQK
jgi:hypothetical protein